MESERHRIVSDAHLTSGNGKLVVFTSGRRAFRQYVERTEGSDTTPTLHTESSVRGMYKQAIVSGAVVSERKWLDDDCAISVDHGCFVLSLGNVDPNDVHAIKLLSCSNYGHSSCC